MGIHVTPIPSTIELAAPAFTLGTANTAGAAVTAVSSNSTLLTFDATNPAAVATSAAVGSAAVAARRDHAHAGITPSGAVFTGNVDLGSSLLVGNDGSTGIAISASGEITMAAQPCVLAYNGATDSNVTGDGTTVTVDYSHEVFDQNGDFATDTFTAPITGRYLLAIQVHFSDIAANMTVCTLIIVTPNTNYKLVQDIAAVASANNNGGIPMAVIAALDASDTVTVSAQISNGSLAADIAGGSSANIDTFFSAKLVA